MPLPVVLLVVFVVSVLTSLAVAGRLTRVVIKPRPPERSRHWNASGIPRIGGVAIFVALPIAFFVGGWAATALSGGLPRLPDLAGPLTAAGGILFLVGIFDDLRGVPPVAKLVAQTAAALIVYFGGFSIEHVSLLPGFSFDLGILALPVTVLWLVGISNAFNLVDGLDGLAGGVAIIGLAASALAAIVLGNGSLLVYALALIGALLGFLRYNLPQARLFLGDSGSLVVGFLLAVIVVKSATDAGGITRGLVPIFALTYPLLDTGVAILRRWLRGVPLSRADLRHIHHQLRALELTPRKSLLVIYCASALSAIVGLLIAFLPPQVTVVGTTLGVTALILAMAFGIHWLEYHEFLVARSSLASAARNARSVIRDKINARDLAEAIRRARSIEEVQAILSDNASTFRFADIKLADADSRSSGTGRLIHELESLRLWKIEYPIVQETAGEFEGLCLSIWCALEAAQRPAGAERVAQIIGPAIAEWARDARRSPAEGSHSERFLHARDANHEDALTTEDKRHHPGAPWEKKTGEPLEA